MESAVKKAFAATDEGRFDEALPILVSLFEQIDRGEGNTDVSLFIVMFAWGQLVEQFAPASQALALARDSQVRRLLAGDAFMDLGEGRKKSRFGIAVDMNDTLKDSRATYDLFIQLLASAPALARSEAFLALPAIVEVGDFVLAEELLPDPLPRLDELNRLSASMPLFPTSRNAPRLAAELSNFIRDVSLRATSLHGLGRESEANQLRDAALAGIASEEMRGLAGRELAQRGTVFSELSAHQMRELPADGAG
jgi:hypothetical protein